jgi:hypothetical protein
MHLGTVPASSSRPSATALAGLTAAAIVGAQTIETPTVDPGRSRSTTDNGPPRQSSEEQP